MTPRKLSLKQFIRETAFLAPECLEMDDYMDEWCDKYFGVKYDEELKPVERERGPHETQS